jgi:hypothetical protein
MDGQFLKAQRRQIVRRTGCSACLVVVLWLLALAAARGNGVSPTNRWVDIYSGNSRFDGQPVPVGANIAAYDALGVLCGEFTVHTAGEYGIMPCYGDDGSTATDEGASAGDVLRFSINGIPATPVPVTLNAAPVPSDTVVIWSQHSDRWEVDLELPATDCSPYDIDRNCTINVADIMIVASRLDCRCGDACYWTLADLDGDCDIDILDVIAVASRYSCHCGDACYR